MAGVSVDGPKGGRKSLDSEINMIPMIDLLMVTVSFLLLTAVWSHMGRLDASAQVPGPASTDPTPKVEQRVHVTMHADDPFQISLREGEKVVDAYPAERTAVHSGKKGAGATQYPALTAALEKQYSNTGVHRAPTDDEADTVVLHTDDDAPYGQVVGVMDAIAAVRKRDRAGHDVPAYRVVFAVK